MPLVSAAAEPGRAQRPGRDRGEHGDAERAADLVAGGVEPGEHPGLLLRGAGEHRDRDADERDAEADTGDQHAGQQVGGVAAAGVDAGEQQHPAGRDGERGGERDAHAGVADDVGAEVDADGEGRCHGQERQSALERAGAEHVLHVDRAEQERAEQHGRDGEHHQRPAADAAVGEALHREQRLRGAQLERGEGGQAHERRGTEPERLRRRPARAVGL